MTRAGQTDPALVRRETLVEAEIAAFEAIDDLAELAENVVETELFGLFRFHRATVLPSRLDVNNEKPLSRILLTFTRRYLISENAMGAHGEFHPQDTHGLKARWREYLAAQGLNTTQQRDLIVDHFLRSRDHISIDELLAKVRKRNRRIGYATVYRTLKLLVDSGLANKRQFGDGQTRYEVAGEHHDHLICTHCGLILEFEDEEIERLQERIASRMGFSVTRHRHELYGMCAKARGVPGGSCPNESKPD